MRKSPATVVAFLSSAVLIASAAGANASTSSPQQIAAQVFASANPSTAYAALSTADRASFDSVERPAAETHTVDSVQRVATPLMASAAATSCWTAHETYRATAAAGNTLYTWWQGLSWCGNGRSVTSYHVYDRGGETSTPGWSYSGNGGQGSINLGWEVRQYTQQKFTFGIGQFGYTSDKCIQIRGSAGGTYSSSGSCNLG